MKNIVLTIVSLLLFSACKPVQKKLIIDTQTDWDVLSPKMEHLKIEQGELHMLADSAVFSSTLKTFQKKQKLKSVTIKQTPEWNTWQPIDKVTPENTDNALVFIPIANHDYWLLAQLKGDTENGYHAWHSTNMETWQHYGPVTSIDHKWVTSAEYADGKFYIYFDYPNDEDPHLIIDNDLTDGQPGKFMGKVLNDPTHGSDMAVFRDDDGTFHIVYEDWSPINARNHAWDSPLAGHADSPDGIHDFLPHEHTPPIDKRTKPTGKIEPYTPHSNQLVHGPDQTPYTFEVHEGEQDAFGDYTMIKVGGQYYMFSDYHPKEENKSMRIGRWRSSAITKEFVWDGEMGENIHPDPTVGFAEGKFYLIVQDGEHDFVSSGPWVDGVFARVGVDTNNDGAINQWTALTNIKEIYTQKEGFARVVNAFPAQIDVLGLDLGFSFKLELYLYKNGNFFPIVNTVEMEWE